MQRSARLQAAVKWRAGFGGKNIVRGYARWFGVDLICAVVELRILGVDIDIDYEKQLRSTIAARAQANARRRAEKLAAKTPPDIGWLHDSPIRVVPIDDDPSSLDENPY